MNLKIGNQAETLNSNVMMKLVKSLLEKYRHKTKPKPFEAEVTTCSLFQSGHTDLPIGIFQIAYFPLSLYNYLISFFSNIPFITLVKTGGGIPVKQ